MNLETFIKTFDKPSSVVLLEGKRDVLPQDQAKLTALGKLLASKTKYITFRSGNAKGSDALFSEGVTLVQPEKLEVITPYSGHREKENNAYQTYNMDEIDLAEEPKLLYETLKQSKNKSTLNNYAAGKRDRFSMKAAYLLRDTAKVLGTSTIKPATFAIFYDDLSNPLSGGTGHTIKVCEENNVPFVNQTVWIDWGMWDVNFQKLSKKCRF